MSLLGSALTALRQPSVQALVVYNSNPAAVAPDQNKVLAGLRREDLFTVVLEHFQTDTANYADILLPASTFLEYSDIYLAYGHYYLQLARPALPAPGEAKSNVEIFRLLAHRMGFQDECLRESDDDMMRGLLSSSSPYLQGIDLERLEREHFVRLQVSPEGEPFLPFQHGSFATANGKFQFGADVLGYVPPFESRLGDGQLRQAFPLELITSKNDDSMNSTFGNRSDVDRQLSVITIHPLDATPRKVLNGTTVRVFNHRGACCFVARVSTDVRPGVLSARSMRWNSSSEAKCGVNGLVSERLTDIGAGPTFYSCLVELTPLGTLDPQAAA